MARTKTNSSAQSSATIGFEAKLWLTADKLRNNMDAAEYKHVVIGLIFLKYISDTFEEHRAKLVAGKGDYEGANPEDPDEYKAENVFWVPKEGRWSHLQASAKQPERKAEVRMQKEEPHPQLHTSSFSLHTWPDAMAAIERDNPRLKGVLPKDYALPGQLFYSTQIPVCLWFLAKNKSGSGVSPRSASAKRQDAASTLRDRRKQTLFIDARKLGTLIDRVHHELTDADLQKITTPYHAWRGDAPPISNLRFQFAGFCKSATTAEITAHGQVLTPVRYVGAEEVADDGDPFEQQMPRLVAELHAQFAESAKLENQIKANLENLNLKPMP